MANKILFISHDINHTGFGQVTHNVLKALRQEFDVVSRTIPFQKPHYYDWHEELKNKSLDGVTHVIQYVLPHHLMRFPGVYNIGMTEIENTNLDYSPWIQHFEKMDEVWVSNEEAKIELEKFVSPVKTVFHPLDLNVYNSDYPSLSFPEETNGNFKFYYIAEHILRKNVVSAIKAFNLEFDRNEPVNLVIKTNEDISDLCQTIKKSLQIYPDVQDYPSEIIINNKMTNEEIYSLHNHCDCYITTSSGESWGQPLYDSQGFGNTAIFTKLGGHLELIRDREEEYQDNVIDVFESNGLSGSHFGHDQNANTQCKLPITSSIRTAMRKAYNKQLNNIPIDNFSFNCFNNKVKNLLESVN